MLDFNLLRFITKGETLTIKLNLFNHDWDNSLSLNKLKAFLCNQGTYYKFTRENCFLHLIALKTNACITDYAVSYSLEQIQIYITSYEYKS